MAINKDTYNARAAFAGSDYFSWHQTLIGATTNDEFVTSRIDGGGGLPAQVDRADPKQLVSYPAAHVYKTAIPKFFSIIQPERDDYQHHATYDVRVPLNTTDIKIMRFADNRRWRYDIDKFESYINRENPSYVFSINAETLFEDFTEFVATSACVPNAKRWLYAYLKCAASTIADVGVDTSTESVELDRTAESDVSSKNINSEVILEIWDNKSKLGMDGVTPIRSGNWRPITPTGFDNNKIIGQVLVDGLYRSPIECDDPIGSHKMANKNGMYKITLVPYNMNENPNFRFPTGFDSSVLGTDGGDGIVNKILYNEDEKKAFHVSYVKWRYDIDTNSDYVVAYVIPLFSEEYGEKEFQETIKLLEDLNPNIKGGPLQILDSMVLSGRSPFDVYSAFADPTKDSGFVKRFIDIRTGGDELDLDRYVSDGMLYFRARVSRARTFPVSHDYNAVTDNPDRDQDSLQHAIIIDPDREDEYSDDDVNPWLNDDDEYETNFDFSKINFTERVKRLAIGYFKLASK